MTLSRCARSSCCRPRASHTSSARRSLRPTSRTTPASCMPFTSSVPSRGRPLSACSNVRRRSPRARMRAEGKLRAPGCRPEPSRALAGRTCGRLGGDSQPQRAEPAPGGLADGPGRRAQAVAAGDAARSRRGARRSAGGAAAGPCGLLAGARRGGPNLPPSRVTAPSAGAAHCPAPPRRAAARPTAHRRTSGR
eukprot:5956193-Prymnesium_polylepis.1